MSNCHPRSTARPTTAIKQLDARLNAYQIDTEDGRSISGIAFKAMGLKPVGRTARVSA